MKAEASPDNKNIGQVLAAYYETGSGSVAAHKITIDDALFLLDLARDEEVQKYIPWAHAVHDKQDAEELIRGFIQRGESRYIIEQEGRSVGYIGIWPDKEQGFYQTGSALLPEFRGRGIVNKVFDELAKDLKANAGAKGVVAYVDEANVSSQQMIAKRGYRPIDEINSQGERKYVLLFE